MIKNYFKTAYRQLLKNKLFTIVNIVGLSTGLASIMALSVLVYQFQTADSNQKDIAQMYYLKTKTPDGGEYKATTYPLLGEIVRNCPEVQAATHIQTWYYPWLKYKKDEFQETTQYVDTGYFRVFAFPFKYGNPATALQNEFSIVLSEEIAQKFFPNENPVGKVLTADDTLRLTVTGVLQHVPANSTIRPTVLIPTAILQKNADFRSGADWYNNFADNYVRLEKNKDPKILEEKIAKIVALNYSPDQKRNKILMLPFSKIGQESSALTGVIIKGAIGAAMFVLLIILFNLINLNTASMYSRVKEVAVKQMIGGSKKNIIIQFCIENGIIVCVSLLFAWMFLSSILLPGMNDLISDKFGSIESGIKKDLPLIILFAGLALLFTILGASLPALKLAAVKFTDAVKGKLVSGNFKGGAIRNIFITSQFILAITIICVAIILNRQIAFMKSSSLGFNKDDVSVGHLDLAYHDMPSAESGFKTILNDLKNNPHVRSVSVNEVVPTAYWDNYNTFYDPVTNKELSMKQAPADAGYIPTYQIPLVEGKNFDDALAASQGSAVLINRTAMNALGWKTAVGRQIKSKGQQGETYHVIGVMEDFHYRDLQNQIEPLIQWYAGPPGLRTNLSIRTDHGYMKPVMDFVEQAMKKISSRRNFNYEMMSTKVDKQYELLQGILRVTNYIAVLTIIIASLGMFGLISLFARQRVREIGIRKVLGASVNGIVKLLSRDFLILVGIAALIACPLALYIMTRWLQDFAYRINISWWMFVVAGLLAIVIVFITVGVQSIKSALANPVKSLRSE